MDVASCMTPDPLVVSPSTTLTAALRLMDDCSIRHLPVVESGRLVGVVSDRDLIGATGGTIIGRRDARAGSTPVADVMQGEFVAVAPDEPVLAAAVEVIVRGIGCVPVMEQGQLLGIVTEMDLLELYSRVCRDQDLTGNDDPAVGKVVRGAAFVVAPEATTSQVEETCQAKEVRHMPVVRDEKLVGIVSDRDLRRAHGAGLPETTRVEEIMTNNVLTIGPETSLSRAAELMREHKITSLPVIDADGIRIITSTDILDHSTSVLRDPAE